MVNGDREDDVDCRRMSSIRRGPAMRRTGFSLVGGIGNVAWQGTGWVQASWPTTQRPSPPAVSVSYVSRCASLLYGVHITTLVPLEYAFLPNAC